MKNNSKGFTLIELLVVIAIIGILASVVVMSLTSARNRSKIAAFKSEVVGAVPGLVTACDATALTTPPATQSTTWAGPSTQNCGSLGDGTFSGLTATATYSSGAGAQCSAAITEKGAVFSGSDCTI